MESEPTASQRHAELMAKAEELKARGNELFKEKEYKKAILRFAKVRAYTWQPQGEAKQYAGSQSQAAQLTDEERASLTRLDQIAMGNIAQCHLQLGEYRKCRDFCNKIISEPAGHPNPDLLVKALCRASQAALESNDLDTSKDLVQRALKIDPKHAPARLTYKKLQEKFKTHNAEQRRQMAAAFEKA